MRIGFTIIYNGAHHLEHNDWGNKLAKMLDYWVIVEGAAGNGGSTSWCNDLDVIHSTDDTYPLIVHLAGNNLEKIYYSPFDFNRNKKWISKDEMVNTAIKELRFFIGDDPIPNFLWQFDIDEQWEEEQIEGAEAIFDEFNADCGCFHANHYVGKDLVAKGTWGEGNDPQDPLRNAYRRLWRWKGQRFATHEPPVLEGGNGKEILLTQRFNHYAYYFEKDVIFKSKYYKGYEQLHDKWLKLQQETEFPQPISKLLDGHWGESETVIEKSVSK